jgi:signal transduction histidine kinase
VPAPSIGQLVAREDHNPEVEQLLDLIRDNKAQLRELLVARERQLRFVARLSGTGGWTLFLSPLRFRPSIEWLELHGWAADDRPTLKMALRAVLPADLAPLIKTIRGCMTSGQPADIIVQLRHRAGYDVSMHMITEAVHGPDGEIDRIEGACQDVTAHVRREQELAKHRDRLEELVEQRTRDLQTFSHALAHDLRAPITAMAGFAQVVAAQLADADAKTRHRLDRIVANAHRAEALIDGILGLISHLQGPLTKNAVDLSAMARGALAELQAAEPQRRVETVVQPGLVAFGDARLLLSVVENLLSNAWKFTSHRADARIEVGRGADGAFCISDNGIGFGGPQVEQLFKPLQRLHHDKEFTGLGIGLATAFRIVQRHGGRMWAHGQPGAGATFCFALPEDVSAP